MLKHFVSPNISKPDQSHSTPVNCTHLPTQIYSGLGSTEFRSPLEPTFSHPTSSSKGMKLGALQLALPRSFEISTGSYGLESTTGCGLQANGFSRASVSPHRRQKTPMTQSAATASSVPAATRDDCAPVAEMKPRPRICRTRSTTYLETMFPC